jgi:hypothetical protein
MNRQHATWKGWYYTYGALQRDDRYCVQVVKRFEFMTRASATSTQQSYQVQGFPLQQRNRRYLSLISAGLLLRSRLKKMIGELVSNARVNQKASSLSSTLSPALVASLDGSAAGSPICASLGLP